MRRHLTLVLFCNLLVSAWLPTSARADELSDAIQQAEQAKAESQRLSRSTEEGRSKARQFYEQTKFVKFQLAGEDYASASSRFDRAADAFHRAVYYLERFRSSRSEGTLNDAQSNLREAGDHYNEGIQHAQRAAEWFNGGIDEYNRQLRDERKEKAEQNRTDAFNLMKSTEEKIKKIGGKSNSAGVVTCLRTANERATWAFNEFHRAVGNVDRPEDYKERTEYGIRYYNQAIEIMKQTSETGKCKL